MEVSQFLMRQMKWREVFSVVEIHGASLWCEGPSNEMRSRGFTGVWWGGLACFHFRLSDFLFFIFFSCSRITVLLQGCSRIFVFLLLLDFWNKSGFEMESGDCAGYFSYNNLFCCYFIIWIFFWTWFGFFSVIVWFFVSELVQLDFVVDLFLHATLLSCGYCVLTFDLSSWMCKLKICCRMKLFGCRYGHW